MIPLKKSECGCCLIKNFERAQFHRNVVTFMTKDNMVTFFFPRFPTFPSQPMKIFSGTDP